MSRVIQCFKMLQELSTHNILNQKQLAELLDTNPRNIREYRKELCAAGIPVEEKRGRNGGYFLPRSFSLSPSGISDKQEEKPDYLQTIERAVNERKKLTLNYQSLSHSRPVVLKVNPIAIIHFEGQPYLVAFSHLKDEFELFFLNEQSVLDAQILDEHFLNNKSFSLEDFVENQPLFHHKVKHFRVWLDPLQESRFLKENTGDVLVKEEKNEEGSLYSFFSDQENELISSALQNQFLVMEPLDTKERLEEIIHNLSSLYLKKVPD